MNSKSNNSSNEKERQENTTEVKASPRAVALAVVTLFIGILLGAVGAGMFTQSQTVDTGVPMEDEAANQDQDNELRVTLNNQLGEHAELLVLVSLDELEKSETEKEPSLEALERNSTDLAATIGSVYGEEAEKEFLELWQSRNDHFVDYIISSKNNNEAGIEQANQDLSEDTEEIALLLADKTGNNQEELVNDFNKQVEQFTGIVQARGNGNNERFYELRSELSRHMAELADQLAVALNDHS